MNLVTSTAELAAACDRLARHPFVTVDTEFLRQLYVLPAHWGTGIGTALLEHGLERMRQRGATRAKLWTLEGNDRGRRFYERRGWSLTDETRVVPYPPNPIDVQYARPLNQS